MYIYEVKDSLFPLKVSGFFFRAKPKLTTKLCLKFFLVPYLLIQSLSNVPYCRYRLQIYPLIFNIVLKNRIQLFPYLYMHNIVYANKECPPFRWVFASKICFKHKYNLQTVHLKKSNNDIGKTKHVCFLKVNSQC